MKLENQVCDIFCAASLHELGVLQGTHFLWREEKMYPENVPVLITINQLPKGIDKDAFNIYSAYTVAELGVLLGEFLNYETFIERTFTACINKAQIPHPAIEEGKNWFCVKSDFSEAECRAHMLINLLKNKLLPVDACNKRLLEW